ncbi:uncharacterized protein [Pyrus communis]|uniref:uncharacterized protein n=1 Tax=Pyrus communis TaxID=23211 RepID=UPI0035C1E027
MLNLNKLDLTALEESGRNYLKWVQDVKLHLTTKGTRATIEEPTNYNPVDETKRATAMIFIQRHINDALQIEYLAEEDPRTLWLIVLITRKTFTCVKQDWQHLRFQEFKFVNEYNSKVCRIQSLFKFCKDGLTDANLLEKTYSTFHVTNIVMQQQYRA